MEAEATHPEHDPEPWLTYTMQTGQNGWTGQSKFKPRDGYCQDRECYDRKKKERNE